MAFDDRRDVNGQRIGKYALIRRLAVGGMAELFLARQTGLEGFEKIVVLKRILPHLAGNANFVEMFLHEARLAASLEHPNVVHVSDFGRSGSDYFFVMAYVHGKDVLTVMRAAHARGEGLPLAHAVTITMGIAGGLHYAHEHLGFDGRPLGIVHRDVSPANVLVTYDGHVKVVDFGIAKAAAQTSVTQAGVRKGKAAYMSPEQCRGRDVDRRSDLFSIGVVLWEMTTMTRLFQGDNDLAMMNQIVHHDARRPSSVNPQYPPGLEAIVMRCLERDPARRYQTAEQLQLALEGFAREHDLASSSRDLALYLQGLFPEHAQGIPGISGPYPPLGDTNIPTRPRAMGSELPTRAEVTPAPGPVTAPAGPGPVTAPAAAGPSAAAPIAPAWASAPPGDGFDHPPITRYERTSSRPSRIGWVIGGAVAGTLVAGTGWFAMQRLVADDASAAAPSAPSDPAPAPRSEPVPPTPEEIEAMLELVNQPRWELALDLPRRHRLLEQLRALPGVAPRIDESINRALDLRQAADAPDPCVAFGNALEQIERDPRPVFASAVAETAVPNATDDCAGLETRRLALGRMLGDPEQ